MESNLYSVLCAVLACTQNNNKIVIILPTSIRDTSVLHDVWFLFFSGLCTGEIFELKAELNSDKKEKKKEAVKKVIASMTVGKDVRWARGNLYQITINFQLKSVVT